MQILTSQPIMHDRNKITRAIADFWNKTSEGWRLIWGPHIHHGFYEDDKNISPQLAQEILIEKLSTHLEINANDTILDVGCGMGGSSIYLANKFHVNMTGITLSEKQMHMATEIVHTCKIPHVTFQIEDALTLASFHDQTFDIVWSLESCEQFFDKNLFLQQAYRVLKPGGKLMLATWCSDREEYTGKDALQYKKLCVAFDLPYMPTIAHYRKLLQANKFKIKHEFDWTTQVEYSWDYGIASVSTYRFYQILRIAGLRGLRFAHQLKLMRQAFREQKIKYGVFIVEK